MSAKDQRQIIGLMLFLVGLFMAVIGAFKSYSDYHSLNSTQLALRTASDILAPDVGITGVGLFLLVLGLIIFFAPSNKAAMRGVKGLFRNRRVLSLYGQVTPTSSDPFCTVGYLD
jgi:succinate dehydrogenase hydrophobic anchor subunit